MKLTKTICDRCGEDIVSPLSPFAKFEQTLWFKTSGHVLSEKEFELCEKCSNELLIFMQGSKAMNNTCSNCNFSCDEDIPNCLCTNYKSGRYADCVGSYDTCNFWEPKADVKGGKCDD